MVTIFSNPHTFIGYDESNRKYEDSWCIYFQDIYHPLENDAMHIIIFFQNTSSAKNAK